MKKTFKNKDWQIPTNGLNCSLTTKIITYIVLDLEL